MEAGVPGRGEEREETCTMDWVMGTELRRVLLPPAERGEVKGLLERLVV